MKEYIAQRTLEIGKYVATNKTTIRATALKFKVSKSTVHKDCTQRLPEINPQLAKEVKSVSEINKVERTARGAAATKEKYLRLKCIKS